MSSEPPCPELPTGLPALLIAARQRHGDMSQEAAAQAAKITVSALRKLESGETQRPRERTLRKLATGLRVDLDQLRLAAGFPPADTTQVLGELAEDAFAREERVVGKVDEFLDRYEELGHTYRRLDQRTETLETRLEDLHTILDKRDRALQKRAREFDRQVSELEARLTRIEELLEELLRSRRGR